MAGINLGRHSDGSSRASADYHSNPRGPLLPDYYGDELSMSNPKDDPRLEIKIVQEVVKFGAPRASDYPYNMDLMIAHENIGSAGISIKVWSN
jgi:hypothetical protein